jgi:hypothetical protein
MDDVIFCQEEFSQVSAVLACPTTAWNCAYLGRDTPSDLRAIVCGRGCIWLHSDSLDYHWYCLDPRVRTHELSVEQRR